MRNHIVHPEILTTLNDAHLLIEVTFNRIRNERITVKHTDHNAFPNTENCHIGTDLINVGNRDVPVFPSSLIERARRFDFDKAIRPIRLTHHTVDVRGDIGSAGHRVDVRVGDDIVVRVFLGKPRIDIFLRNVSPQLVQPG